MAMTDPPVPTTSPVAAKTPSTLAAMTWKGTTSKSWMVSPVLMAWAIKP